jgi:NAD(P)-dependent dehydrogenase (short-subunit alcohol dehydrogenase family)
MIASFQGKAVLVAGSGGELEAAFLDAFRSRGAVCYAGAIYPEESVLRQIRQSHDRPEVLIQYGCGETRFESLRTFSREAFLKSMDERAWPLFDLLTRLFTLCGSYPRYAIAISSPSPNHYSPGYDFAAPAEAALETLCRYVSYRLFDEDIRINVLRIRPPGPDFQQFTGQLGPSPRETPLTEIASAAVALCSGLMDAVQGEVLTVDRGATFCDSVMRLYSEQKRRDS